MLSKNDAHWLSGQLAATAEAMGHVLSENAIVAIAGELMHFSKDQLQVALARTRAEGSGRLTLNAVLQRLDAGVGRYGPEEAWGLAIAAADERNTVVWNTEVQQAWAVAGRLMSYGDKVGARMAFKQAYERITQDNRVQKVRPEPLVSVGWDDQLRVAVIIKGYEQGYLPLDVAQPLLAGDCVQLNGGKAVVHQVDRGPAIEYTPSGQPYKTPTTGNVLTHLIAGPATATASPEILAKLRAAAKKAKERAPRRRAAKVRLEAYKFKKAKEAAAQAAQAFINNQGKSAS